MVVGMRKPKSSKKDEKPVEEPQSDEFSEDEQEESESSYENDESEAEEPKEKPKKKNSQTSKAKKKKSKADKKSKKDKKNKKKKDEDQIENQGKEEEPDVDEPSPPSKAKASKKPKKSESQADDHDYTRFFHGDKAKDFLKHMRSKIYHQTSCQNSPVEQELLAAGLSVADLIMPTNLKPLIGNPPDEKTLQARFPFATIIKKTPRQMRDQGFGSCIMPAKTSLPTAILNYVKRHSEKLPLDFQAFKQVLKKAAQAMLLVVRTDDFCTLVEEFNISTEQLEKFLFYFVGSQPSEYQKLLVRDRLDEDRSMKDNQPKWFESMEDALREHFHSTFPIFDFNMSNNILQYVHYNTKEIAAPQSLRKEYDAVHSALIGSLPLSSKGFSNVWTELLSFYYPCAIPHGETKGSQKTYIPCIPFGKPVGYKSTEGPNDESDEDQAMRPIYGEMQYYVETSKEGRKVLPSGIELKVQSKFYDLEKGSSSQKQAKDSTEKKTKKGLSPQERIMSLIEEKPSTDGYELAFPEAFEFKRNKSSLLDHLTTIICLSPEEDLGKLDQDRVQNYLVIRLDRLIPTFSRTASMPNPNAYVVIKGSEAKVIEKTSEHKKETKKPKKASTNGTSSSQQKRKYTRKEPAKEKESAEPVIKQSPSKRKNEESSLNQVEDTQPDVPAEQSRKRRRVSEEEENYALAVIPRMEKKMEDFKMLYMDMQKLMETFMAKTTEDASRHFIAEDLNPPD